MSVPSRSVFKAVFFAASTLFFIPVLVAESFDPDSGWGIYSDTRNFDADAGDGIYSDTRFWASTPSTIDASFDADSGEGVYSDTSEWDDGGQDPDYPDYWSVGTDDSPAASTEPLPGDPVPAGIDYAPSDAAAADTPVPDEPPVASDDESVDEDLWGMFDEAEDVQGVESAPVTDSPSKGTSDEKKFEWWGYFTASGGLTFQMFPEGSTAPFAIFQNTLGFTAKPFDDMVVRGSFYSEFPEFNFDLKTLYFDYIMNDKLYVTAGKTGTAWGNSQIFDTNLLDDEGDGRVVNPYADKTDTGQRFDAILTLPIWKGEIQGIGMYSIGNEISKDNLSYAAKIQYPFGPVSLELFARKWATSDAYWMQPAVGASLTTDILKNHINLWGMTHFSLDDVKNFDFKPGLSRFVGGVSRIIETNAWGKFGIAAEYQMTYDPDKPEDDRMTHDIGVTFGWSHAMGTDFSPAVRWWYNPISKQGYLLPSLTFTGLRHVDISLTVPYVFGGATYDNGKIKLTSTPDEPLVMFGLVFSISVSY